MDHVSVGDEAEPEGARLLWVDQIHVFIESSKVILNRRDFCSECATVRAQRGVDDDSSWHVQGEREKGEGGSPACTGGSAIVLQNVVRDAPLPAISAHTGQEQHHLLEVRRLHIKKNTCNAGYSCCTSRR